MDNCSSAPDSSTDNSVLTSKMQRPDLFGCALAHVGVMDMLRFHKFTIGKFFFCFFFIYINLYFATILVVASELLQFIFHFSLGHAWTSDFGCSDKEEEFQWLIK